MSSREEYPAGVPCWVEGLGPNDVSSFYAGVFGWTFNGVARLDGRAVAGLGRGDIAAWVTYVRVERGSGFLQDPAGAVIGVRSAGGAELVNEPGAWTMSSLHTTDPEGAIAWYGEQFGWVAEPFGPLTAFRLPGYAGEPGQMIPPDTVAVMAPPDPDVPTHWSVGFQVADADAAVLRTSELGGRVLMGPVDLPGFRSAVLLDPNGAAFTVNQVTSVA